MTGVLLLLALLGAPQDRPGKFEWAKDLDSAMAQSAKDGRPVVTYWTFHG